jgi:hypothetical protein
MAKDAAGRLDHLLGRGRIGEVRLQIVDALPRLAQFSRQGRHAVEVDAPRLVGIVRGISLEE